VEGLFQAVLSSKNNKDQVSQEVAQPSEEQIIAGIRNGDGACFQTVFSDHYDRLCQYAFTLLRSMDEAEDVVQSIFVKWWEKRAEIQINQTVKAYLFRAVYNLCINQLEHQQVKQKHLNHATYEWSGEKQSPEVFPLELEERITSAINQLPEQCRIIFKMSRYEELKYNEIASKLGISPNTVENQISKALRILRSQLDIFVQR
jgi:RNA polymerase sigma-70 factor (ECF subfamily)